MSVSSSGLVFKGKGKVVSIFETPLFLGLHHRYFQLVIIRQAGTLYSVHTMVTVLACGIGPLLIQTASIAYE